MRTPSRPLFVTALIALSTLAPDLAPAQTADPDALFGSADRRATTGSRSAAILVHETTKGVFIDPLITEHAFVDRKVRNDFDVRLLREEGELFIDELVFEYAFTHWFALEFTQPYLITTPDVGESTQGLGDLGIGARFQLTRADETGGFIFSTGLEGSLPSGEEDVGAGEEYEVAPVVAVDWAIGSGLFKVQSQAELEFAIPRGAGETKAEAFGWNTALSYFRSDLIVPLLEFNAEFAELEEDVQQIFAVTPGVVVSLQEIAGKSFDVAAGAQIFFGADREEDVAVLVSLRHHWPLPGIVPSPTLDSH